VYSLKRGTVFAPGSGAIAYDAERTLYYFVSRDNEVVLLEQDSRRRTWSEMVALKARRGGARVS
jgi:hypothetical protein